MTGVKLATIAIIAAVDLTYVEAKADDRLILVYQPYNYTTQPYNMPANTNMKPDDANDTTESKVYEGNWQF